MDREQLQRRLEGETALWLERLGDGPLDQHGLAALSLALLALNAGAVAAALDAVRDGDCVNVNRWDCGKI